MNSYFVSPVAYLLLVMFAVLIGFFFWNSLGAVVFYGIEAQLSGQPFPMTSTSRLCGRFCPTSTSSDCSLSHDHDALFAEEKRSGTIELLATRQSAIVKLSSQMACGSGLYGCML